MFKKVTSRFPDLKKMFAILLLSILFLSAFPFHSKADECHKSAINKLKEIGVELKENHINHFNKDNLKHGIWLDVDEYHIRVINYLNGEKHGAEMIYSNSLNPITLSYIFLYENGVMNTNISFDRGRIVSIIEDFKRNTDFKDHPTIYVKEFKFPFQGFVREFKDTGEIEAEGYMVFGEDFEIDCERVGKWKLYNPDGTFVIKDYLEENKKYNTKE